MGKQNEFVVSRDEQLHQNFAILLYTNYISNKLSKEEAESIVRDAVAIEERFCRDSIPVEMIGMSSSLMIEYVHFIADRLLVSFGYDKIYNATNPFSFMLKSNLLSKTNFFEQRTTEYTLKNEVPAFSNAGSLSLDDLDNMDF